MRSAIKAIIPLTMPRKSDNLREVMNHKAHFKITARLPQALGIRLKREAQDNLCSASDVVRKALLHFFGPSCLTNNADGCGVQEATK